MSKSSSSSNRKGSHDTPIHRSRSKKKTFSGNRYTYEQSTENTSTAAEKLLRTGDDGVKVDHTHGYRFVQFYSVFSAISSLVVCKNCKKDIKFNEASSRGLGFKIAVSCECGVSYVNSGPMIGNAYEINRRIVFVMRLVGVGINGLNLFCGLMDLSKFHNNTFAGCFENLTKAAKTVYEWSTQKAVTEERAKTLENKGSDINLTVSGDGTWKNRGNTSLYGVTTLAGEFSKKIIDSIVKSTHCNSCEVWEKKKDTHPEEYEEWLEGHDDCDFNHIESAEKIEVDSVKEMISRSIDQYGLDKGVAKASEPICTDSSSRELLERCKGENTQNNNEIYNDLLWYFAPKHLHNGLKTIELANFLAVSIFNDGFYAILKMLQVMDVIVGPTAKEYAIERDDSRINQVELRHGASSKEGLTARRKTSASQQATFEEEEGPLYGPGVAD